MRNIIIIVLLVLICLICSSVMGDFFLVSKAMNKSSDHMARSPLSPKGSKNKFDGKGDRDRSGFHQTQIKAATGWGKGNWSTESGKDGQKIDAVKKNGGTGKGAGVGLSQRQKGSSLLSSECIPGALDPSPADCTSYLDESGITPGPIGTRTPLILIHGIHSDPTTFDNLLRHFDAVSGYLDFKNKYKVYRFKYNSDSDSVWDIARSLRNRLDFAAKHDPYVYKPIVIIAHSMGGLVARSYMNEHDSDYDPVTGGRTRIRAGERVSLLITLSTPHHGSPLANENPRVPNSDTAWNTVVGAADAVWGHQGCWVCITNPEHFNRSDLRWDNYDNLWQWSDYNNDQERNGWLRGIPHKYDYKIIAYGGYIGTNSDILDLGQVGPVRLVDRLWDKAYGFEDHLRLNALSVVLQRITKRNFEHSINEVNNDGAVPIESSLFNGSQVKKAISCRGYDHQDMVAGNSPLCSDGLSLFKSIVSNLSLAPIQTAPTSSLSTNPDSSLNYGNISIGNTSSKTITLSNTGSSDLSVSSLWIGGADSSQFAIDNQPTTPFTIAAGQSRSVSIRYAPSSSGNKGAALTISNTSGNSPVKTINLSGSAGQAGCNYTLSSQSRSFGPSGGSGNFSVQAGNGCSWTVRSSFDWITITSSASGTGTQSVNFVTAPNQGNSFRMGMISIQAGKITLIFTIVEDGNIASCNYSLSSNYQSYTGSGGSGSFLVATSGGCGWSAVSNSPWIILDQGSSGLKLGTGSINYSVTANPLNNVRTGTITVTWQGGSSVHTVSEDGSVNNCAYSLSTYELNTGEGGIQSSFVINAGAGCPWHVSSTVGWITNLSTNNGYGSQTIGFLVQANQASSIRSGSIIVQGGNSTLAVNISQAGVPVQYPVISLPNTSISMGDGLVNTTIYQGVLINNIGPGYLVLGSVYRSGGSSDFDILPYGQNQTIAPGGSTSVTIKLTPVSTGNRSATFSISSNDPNQPIVNFIISGNGVNQLTGGIDFVWSNYTNIPESKFIGASSAVINNNIYIFGGSYLSRGYKFDPTTKSWIRIADLPYPTDEGGAEVINGKIYLVCGWLNNKLLIYDPSSNLWASGADIPVTGQGIAVTALNGKLYAIGGTGRTSLVHEYNPSTNTWATKSPIPTPRSYASVAVFNNVIYVISGQGWDGTRTFSVEIFDPVSDTWSTRQDIPTSRASASAVMLNNKIYVIGGSQTGPDALAVVEEHDPSIPGLFGTWFMRNPVITGRTQFIAEVVNNKVYVIGGRSNSGEYVLSVEEGVLAASPKISLPVTSFVCSDVQLGNICEKRIEIQNQGNSTLTINAYFRSSGSSDFQTYRGADIIAPGQSATLVNRFIPNSIGSKSAVFTINSNDPSTPSIMFTMSGTATPAPVFSGSWQAIRTIQLSGSTRGARRIAISNNKAYVTRALASLSVVDLNSGQTVNDITFTAYPNGSANSVAISGNKAYITLSNLGLEGQLAVVNTDTNMVLSYIPVGNEPFDVAVGNSRLYVSNLTNYGVGGAPSTVKVVEESTGSVISTISVGQRAAFIATDQSLGRVYVTNRGLDSSIAANDPTKSLSVIDATTNTVVATISLPYEPAGIALTKSRAYVATGSTVEVIDLSSNSVVASIPVPYQAFGIAATPDYVFVTDESTTVTVISIVTNTIIGKLSVTSPHSFAVDSSTGVVYVVGQTNSSITALRFIAPSFKITTNSQSLASAAGGNTVVTTIVTSIDGYSGPVTHICEGLPAGATCQFSNNPVDLPAGGSVATNLTITVPIGTVSGSYSPRVLVSGSAQINLAGRLKNDLSIVADTTTLTDYQNLSLTVPSCDYSLSTDSVSVGTGASTGNVDVGGTTGCSWTAQSNVDWVIIASGASGNGNGTVGYSIIANPDPTPRTGTLTIAGRTFTVIQSAATSSLRIDTVTPVAGRDSGGQHIKLSGSFVNLLSVMVGSISATWVYTNGTIEVTVTTPPHAAGAVNIDLTSTSGSAYSKPNAFAYLPTAFTDNTLVVGVTTAKAQHIIELRQAVDALRAVAGLAPAPWTDPTLMPSSTLIMAVHITELRFYLEDAVARLGYPAGAYTDPALNIGFVIKQIHIEELRQRIRAISG